MNRRPGLWFVENEGGAYWETVLWSIREVGPDGTIATSTAIAEGLDYDFADRIVEEHNKVRAFIRERQEYADAELQSNGSDSDYHWRQGHMESREQLAQKLGLPYEFNGGAS